MGVTAGDRPLLTLDRAQILAYRRRVGALDERLPPGPESLRRAAWAGLQDSMPRAALLSIHARVEGTGPSAWEDPSLVQVWGPRFSAFVVAAPDAPIFTLGRYPEDERRRRLGEDLAARLEELLAGGRMPYGEAGHALGVHPNMLRYAAPTGRVRIRWEGSRQPTIWTVPAPEVEVREARLELARRYLHVFGPGTVEGFGEWAGVKPAPARRTFDELAAELVGVATPIGDGLILAADEAAFREPAPPPAPARLLPSGDAHFLLQGRDREVLVPDASRQRALWTPRVWPGAVLVRGEIVGTWRRADWEVTISPWLRLSDADRQAVESEAASLPLPLPGLTRSIAVRWEG